ncbi:glycosyltransferase, group 1 family protein [Clostridiales bacterium oral taxon 876 str. F0540]|nr:glycosyltransferase, group 1 family protein [Clostridiales bacterium oral taxon 876 str. F0540]
MRNIYFNGMILNNNPTGLGVYTENILDRLLEKYHVNYLVVHNKEYVKDNIKNIDKTKMIDLEYKDSKISFLFRNYKFRKFVKENVDIKNDIVYSPTQHGLNIKGLKQIITIHDLMPLLYPKGRVHQYYYYKYILPKVIKHVNYIITVSENTKEDIIKYYNVDPNIIHVIYNGVDKPGNIGVDESKAYIFNKYKLQNYLLMVGINYKYKNLHRVIEAYNKIKNTIDTKLVIVGNYKVAYGRELIKLTQELNLENNVLFLGYVSREEKEMLYKAANMFIYPSLYEGFGIPVLEAMSNGVPVACSNSSSLPEVAKDAAVMFDPNSIDEIEKSIKEVFYLDKSSRNKIIELGFNNVKKFSWDTAAKSVFNVISKLN